jgi:hypothetical protein
LRHHYESIGQQTLSRLGLAGRFRVPGEFLDRIEELFACVVSLNNDSLSHSNSLPFPHYEPDVFAPRLPFGDFRRPLGFLDFFTGHLNVLVRDELWLIFLFLIIARHYLPFTTTLSLAEFPIHSAPTT